MAGEASSSEPSLSRARASMAASGRDPGGLLGAGSAAGEAPVVLASGSMGGAGAAPRLPTLSAPQWLRVPRLAAAQRPLAVRLALTTLLSGTFAVVAFATASQNVLVPRGYLAFPPWDSGPLHLIFRHLPVNQTAINIGFSLVVLAMLCAYGVAIVAVRLLSVRTIVLTVVALHAIVLLSPPLQLTDVFNYLGYARLGALHHLSPYTHVIGNEIHDPVYRFASWHNLSSPYGPLFTAMTYPLALLPLPVAYWIVKVVTMLSSLALIALVAQCARQLGRDPRYVVVFLALNPIYIIYAMGGFHNDFLMLVPMLGAVSMMLAGRDRLAGAVLMPAVAIKFTAVLLLPFLLVAVRQNSRRARLLVGCALGAIPMVAVSLGLFGPHMPNLGDQSTLLTDFSIPQLLGLMIGIGGGTAGLLRVLSVLLVVAVAVLVRRRGDWLVNAGWATVALIASLAWLMPWYVIWLLPLAGLGTSLRLRRAAVVLTVFLIVTFIPITGMVMFKHGLDPMNTSVGHASSALQRRLSH